MKKEEDSVFWFQETFQGDRGPTPPEPVPQKAVDESFEEFTRATKHQRGWIVAGLAAAWLLGTIGCYLAGLALHETAHLVD
jgi:hypothetical protein